MPVSENRDRSAAIRGETWLYGFCRACGHGARLEQSWAVRVASGNATPDGLAKHLKCSKCGQRAGLVAWAVRPIKG